MIEGDDDVLRYVTEMLYAGNHLHRRVRDIKIALDKVKENAARNVTDFTTTALSRLDDLYEYIPTELDITFYDPETIEKTRSAVRDIMAVLDECKGSAGGVLQDGTYLTMATKLRDIYRDIDLEDIHH